jgi:pescadillo protein
MKSKVINTAKTLAAAWGAYCATAGCVTKSFISVKGVYLEANIRSVPVRWIVPHVFTQFLPDDVDYRVMTTFFEFYETLMHFVLFKLYSDMGVRYPLPTLDAAGPVMGSTNFIMGANLRSLTNAMKSSSGAISNVVSEGVKEDEAKETKPSKSKSETKKSKELIKSVGAALNSINEDSDDGDDDDEKDVDVAGPLKAALESMADDEARAALPTGEVELDDEALKRRRLFAGLTFFLSREVPRGYLELVCLAFGGKVGWEGPNSPITVNDQSITHHIVDRPKLPASYDVLPKSREYVQPQWILDCSNFMFLLPISKYEVGAALPPHLSPWVDDEEEGYKPQYAEEIEKLKNGETIETEAGDTEIAEESDSESDKEEEEEESSAEEEKEESEEEVDEEEAKKRAEKKRLRDEKETHALAKTMMSRKASHLYGRMQHGIAKKKAKVDTLNSRRKELVVDNTPNRRAETEITKAKDPDGRSSSKQRVERLKKERKNISDGYKNTGGSMKKNKK